VSGRAQILIDPNVIVSVYAAGNVTIEGFRKRSNRRVDMRFSRS